MWQEEENHSMDEDLIGFDTYDEYGKRSANGKQHAATIAVTFHRQGAISLNQVTYDALHRPTHVLLHCQKEAKVLCIQPVGPDTLLAIPVKKQGDGTHYTIAAKRFRTKYDIKVPPTAVQYVAETRNGKVFSDLKSEGIAIKNPRAGYRKKKDSSEPSVEQQQPLFSQDSPNETPLGDQEMPQSEPRETPADSSTPSPKVRHVYQEARQLSKEEREALMQQLLQDDMQQ